MAAPKENQFWKLVQKPTGRPNTYTPDELWDKALDYFEWVHENPLMETKMFSYEGGTHTGEVPKMRAMTEIAFCLFAGINQETFRNYKSGKEPYQEFFEVASDIAAIIYQQKIEGAAADFLNANIIARELGLKERTEATEIREATIRVIRSKNA